MAIINPGDNVIMENVVDGTELARRIERFMAAFHSQNSNPTRPPSLTSGGIWTRTGSPGDPMPMLFDGTTDVPLRPVTWKASFVIGNDAVLDAQHANSRIILSSGTNQNITLPPIASCSVGAMILIGGSAKGSITAAAGDIIAIQGNTVGMPVPFIKQEYDSVIFIRGGTSWSADLGGSILPQSSQFARSLATTGYQKLPGGFIIQWGQTPAVGTANIFIAGTFPIAFPNACFTILGTAGIAAASVITAATRVVSTSQFEYGADEATAAVRWMAVGN